MIHLNQNKLLSNDQYGFRSGRSCAIQLLEILDEWTQLIDEGNPIDVIYLDFSKAFDKVAHDRLSMKLNNLGICGTVHKWIKSFLQHRVQSVRIGSCVSSWSNVVSGVPQGSVLGPVLFLCFINDLPQVVEGIVKIFADDTKIYSAISDPQQCEKLQQDLDNLCNWSTESKLSFNASKCKVMHIGSNNDCARYTMQDIDGNYVKVEPVASEKDLGVIFDSRLTFEEHITEIASKAHRVTGMIWRSFEFMNKDMFLNLYKSIIRPIVEYGSCVWSPYLKKDIKRLEDVQRRATKLVKDVSDLSYEQRLKALGIPTLEYRRDRADMIQIYKSVYGHDELKWDHLFTLSSGDLRGHHLKFVKKKSKHNSRLYSFSQRSIMYWNSLSEETVSAKSINQFKSMLNIEHWNRKKFLC